MLAGKQFKTTDEYISSFPENIRQKLEKIRKIVRAAAPAASEAISYQMPTFKLRGNLVHFAAYKNHIGFYPTPSAVTAFKKELSAYKTSKGAIQFSLDKPIPYDLIKNIVLHRLREFTANN